LNAYVLAYGNIDRQDDGVAWFVLKAIMEKMGVPSEPSMDDEYPIQFHNMVFDFHLQLTPELADAMGQYDRICFIDAHTGNVPEEIHIQEVTPEYQSSPFTHHMTPHTLLSICQVLHQKAPQAILTSIRGYEFKFTRSLSSATQELVEPAADLIVEWLNSPKN
jgi:hydrogenase maturation protease